LAEDFKFILTLPGPTFTLHSQCAGLKGECALISQLETKVGRPRCRDWA